MEKNETINDFITQNACWQYDEHAKNLLADKEILAYILKYATDEFKDMPIKDIIPCIEGTPEIGRVPVSPGLTNVSKNYVENNVIPEDERKLIELLKTLFSNELSQKEKKESLQNNYDIPMNETIDKELMDMCNLGYGVFEQGEKRGLEQGEKRGKIETLLNQVLTKYLKGKSCLQIAEELETDLSIIERIYEVLEQHAEADATENELVDILLEKNVLQKMV